MYCGVFFMHILNSRWGKFHWTQVDNAYIVAGRNGFGRALGQTVKKELS